MTANQFKAKLKELRAWGEIIEWAEGKDWPTFYATCERGDWLVLLFAVTNPDDLQLRALVCGHQANLVRDKMTHPDSLKAVDTAIAFGEGRATREELREAASAACCVSRIARAAVLDFGEGRETKEELDVAARAAARIAARVSCTAINADFAAVYPGDAASAAELLRKTADIFREHIPIQKFNLL